MYRISHKSDYYNTFLDTIKSPYSRKVYNNSLQLYLKYTSVEDANLLEAREANLIQDQLKVYALYRYHVLKLLDLGGEYWSHDVHQYMADDLKRTFDALDAAVTDKYYLLNPEEVLDLISIRKAFKYRNKEWVMVKNELDSLNSRLTEEYNKTLCMYNQIMRKHK